MRAFDNCSMVLSGWDTWGASTASLPLLATITGGCSGLLLLRKAPQTPGRTESTSEPGVADDLLRLRAENAALRRALLLAGVPLPSEIQRQQKSTVSEQGNGRLCRRPGCHACSDTGLTHWFTPAGTNLTAAATVMPLPCDHSTSLPPSCEAPTVTEINGQYPESESSPPVGGECMVGYTTQGVRVGDRLYPFPKPKYLLQLIKLCESKHNDTGALPLLRLLTKKRYQHAKEISENFGALAAMRSAVDDAPGLPSWFELTRSKAPVRVYVPGDGRRPYAAATVCLHTPSSWHVWSIDPVMEKIYALDAEGMNVGGCESKNGKGGRSRHPLGAFCSRLTCVRATTEDFVLPEDETPEVDTKPEGEERSNACPLSIVLAVHSHCPLSDFVARIPGRLLVVSLPCCGIILTESVN